MSQVSALAIRQPGSSQIALSTQTREEVLRDTYMPGAHEHEVQAFIAVCKQTGLDYLSREIYPVKRWDSASRSERWAFQTGIDGYRKIAESTGQYAGQLPLEWCGEDGVWKDVWLAKTPPAAARARVLRKGFAEPITRVALWSEYCQKDRDGNPRATWKSLATTMLAKCAEAQALRAAFPASFKGIYAEEEMQQTENEQPAAKPTPRETIQAKTQTIDDTAKWLTTEPPTTKSAISSFVTKWMNATGCTLSGSGARRKLADAAGFAGIESSSITEQQWKAIGAFAHDAASNGLTIEQATDQPIPAGTDTQVRDNDGPSALM